MKNNSTLITVICFVALSVSLSTLAQEQPLPEIAAGKFVPTDESLKQYEYPQWFRDAKFGIWAHWGPQAGPRQGDWYAKKMYLGETIDRKTNEAKGPDPDYTYHVKTYGHPSKFGYKGHYPALES